MKNAIYLLIGLSVLCQKAIAQAPTYNIIQLTQPQNSNNVPDSLGVHARITGTVYGINVKAGGLEFTLHDATGGIEVFSSTDDFGYTVNEGDSLIIQGVVAFYDGVTEFQSLDTLINLGTGTTHQPVVVNALNESTESELIRINNLVILSPAQWVGSGGTGFNCIATDGISNYTIFVYPLVDLYTMPAPTGTFDLIGIGSQHCTAPPYNTAYSITPRYHQDVIEHSTGVMQTDAENFKVYPNPGNGRFTIAFDNSNQYSIKLYDVTGKIMYASSQNSRLFNIDAGNLNSGIYVLEVQASENIYRQNISIQK